MISVWELQNKERKAIIITDIENITVALNKSQSQSLLFAIRNFLTLRLKKENIADKEFIAFFGEHPRKKKAYLKKTLKILGFKIRSIKLKPPYYAEQIDHALLSYLHRLARKYHKIPTDIVLIASDNDYANGLAEIQRKWRFNNIARVIVISRANSSKLKKWSSEFWKVTIKRTNQLISINQKDFKAISVNGYTVVFERLK